MPRLVMISGDRSGEHFTFEGRLLVGRGQFADLRLDDGTVSRRHAQLDVRQGDVFLSDLGSANGTRHNGKAVSSEVALRDGDTLQFGQVSMVLSLETTKPVVPDQTRSAPSPAAQQDPSAMSGLFQEVLGRVKLFAELGALASGESIVDEQVARFLEAMHRAFPSVEQLAVLLYVPAADSFAVFSQIAKGADAESPELLARVAHQSMSHQQGMLVVDIGRPSTATPSVVMSLKALQASSSPQTQRLPPSLACFPVRFGVERMGALYLASRSPGALRASDRDVLAAASGVLAWLLAAQQQAGPDLKVSASDFGLARRIQQRFLPEGLPQVPGYAIADSYTSARAIGGDHYEYLQWPKQRLGIMVSDVSGKALSGALYVARLGARLQHLAQTATTPAALLEAINAAMYPEMESGMFITIAVLSLDVSSGQLRLALAGHPPPLLRRANGEVSSLSASSGVPIGASADARYQETEVTLEPGDLVLMFTDGLDEAQNRNQQLFGMPRIRQVLAGCTDPDSAIKQLRKALGDFVGSQPQSDDLTLVCLGRDASPRN